MDQILLQIGVGGALAWLIIKEVLDFLAKRKESADNPERRTDDKSFTDIFAILKSIRKEVGSLYEWHNHDDPHTPGSKVWYGTAVISRIDEMELKFSGLITRIKEMEKKVDALILALDKRTL